MNTKEGGLTVSHKYTYESYSSAKKRCRANRFYSKKDYYDRWIKFLFTSFRQFLDVMGPRPHGMTLDRIDNDGNYEPGNTRWCTQAEQNAKKRGNFQPGHNSHCYYWEKLATRLISEC